ncbi:C-X-C motif chemokine 16 [Camelus ferus]|uniref:C-X-C motif chemokine 16 n=2 Tax=Camelus TaxID=9836 RepID=A0A8B7K7D9_CAMFR|nr:C-X-C motif chemokine 16 [Camelus bactrianus]XP_014411086.2 C-X-C motif chemokine 16 [Camelus ferus]
MLLVWEARSLLLLTLLIAWLTPQADSNEGSIVGSCPCNRRFSSHSPPNGRYMGQLQKRLKAYQRCNSYVRFQLPLGSVCGGSSDRWVQELMHCFDRRECGLAYTSSMARQRHLPSRSTQVPDPTERARSDTSTPTQMYLPDTLQSTQPSTLPADLLSSDQKLILTNQTTMSSVGHSLGVKPEARENQKQGSKLEENVGPAAGTSAMVPVLSLLAIVFVLTGVLLYVVCKRRRERSPQHFPDLQLHYVPVAGHPNA